MLGSAVLRQLNFDPRRFPFSTDFLNRWVASGLPPETGDSPPGNGVWTLARRPFLTVNPALYGMVPWRPLQH